MPASRSLIALLVGTVAFFALWLVALKPSSSSSGGGRSSSQGLGQYQSAINKAHQAVQTSNASNAASGNDGSSPSAAAAPATAASAPAAATTPSATAHGAAKVTTNSAPSRATPHSAAAASRLSTVQHALSAHKVVAILFFNPAATDDQAVRRELAAVPTHKGKVVKLTVPLNEASYYTAVTQQVPVNLSPTLVLIAADRQAGEIVGFSDSFEIGQRVDDAVAAK